MTARPANAGETAAGARDAAGGARENVIGYLFDEDGRQVRAVGGHAVLAADGTHDPTDFELLQTDGDLALTLTLRGKVALTAAMAATHHRTTPAELVDRLIAAEGQRIGIRKLADAREGRGDNSCTPAPRAPAAPARRDPPLKGEGGSAR